MPREPYAPIQEVLSALKQANQRLHQLAYTHKGSEAYDQLLNTLEGFRFQLKQQQQRWEKEQQKDNTAPLSILGFKTKNRDPDGLVHFLQHHYRYQEINTCNTFSTSQITGPFDLLVGLFHQPSIEDLNSLAGIRKTLPFYIPVIVFVKQVSESIKQAGIRLSLFPILSTSLLPCEIDQYFRTLLQQKRQIEMCLATRLFRPAGYYPTDKPSFLRELDMAIESQIDELTIPILCRALNYSRSHLSRKIKKLTGLKLTEYINHYKLEKSRLLLLQTEWSIGRIADALGFCSQQYFTQLFSKNFGISPGRYRTVIQHESTIL